MDVGATLADEERGTNARYYLVEAVGGNRVIWAAYLGYTTLIHGPS